MKLDKIDRKLLTYLYHHFREPLTKIAKVCRVSRDQVNYRLRRYEDEGLIKKYLTIFNYDLFGYKEFIIVLLKINSALERKKLIKKELENLNNVASVGDVIGHYDLFVDFVFKTKEEFEKIFYSFLEKHQEINDYFIFITTYAEFFPLKTFGVFDEEKTYEFVSPATPVKIDKKSLSILRLLEENGRVRVIDIAGRTNLSSELIVYKLKQLHKEGIILGSRIQFDMEKLGFYFGNVILRLKDKTEKTKEKIKEFCKSHSNINALSFGISEYNCIIQIFYQQEEEFRETLRDIRDKFSQEIEKSKIILIENEGKVKTLPL